MTILGKLCSKLSYAQNCPMCSNSLHYCSIVLLRTIYNVHFTIHVWTHAWWPCAHGLRYQPWTVLANALLAYQSRVVLFVNSHYKYAYNSSSLCSCPSTPLLCMLKYNLPQAWHLFVCKLLTSSVNIALSIFMHTHSSNHSASFKKKINYSAKDLLV